MFLKTEVPWDPKGCMRVTGGLWGSFSGIAQRTFSEMSMFCEGFSGPTGIDGIYRGM